jgi:epoxyqueuosine reductase
MGGMDLAARVEEVGLAAGLAAVGIAAADPFEDTRAVLEERKAAGLHGGMHFTYGDPARSTDPERALPGAVSLVVGAWPYNATAPEPPAGEPVGRVARYSWRDHYEPLRAALAGIATELEAAGWRARVLADDNALVDRAAAVRAGIGWYGKNANVLLPGKGSWFVLGAVLTDAPLPPAPRPVEDGCGACTRCMPACPTGAIVAPGVIDARRCLAWILEAPGDIPMEVRASMGDRIYGCDDCQEACPPNRTAARHAPPAPATAGDQPWVPLLHVLAADDETILGEYGRWYIPKRRARFVRRNALVALGNVGDPGDPRVIAALERFRRGDDVMLSDHAAWAMARLEQRVGTAAPLP